MGKCVRKIDSLVLVWYVWHENVSTGIVSVRAFFVDFFVLVFICLTVYATICEAHTDFGIVYLNLGAMGFYRCPL